MLRIYIPRVIGHYQRLTYGKNLLPKSSEECYSMLKKQLEKPENLVLAKLEKDGFKIEFSQEMLEAIQKEVGDAREAGIKQKAIIRERKLQAKQASG